MATEKLRAALTACVGASLTACALPRAAVMDLPAELSAREPIELPFRGSSEGSFALGPALGGGTVHFQRSATQWSLFGMTQFNNATLNLRWQVEASPPRQLACRAHRQALQVASVEVGTQPTELVCEGQETHLSLQARPGAVRETRRGSITQGTWTLTFDSVHALQGTPLPVAHPAGYVLRMQGLPVAALDLLGTRPQLRLLPMEAAQRDVAVLASLVLALSWAPAD